MVFIVTEVMIGCEVFEVEADSKDAAIEAAQNPYASNRRRIALMDNETVHYCKEIPNENQTSNQTPPDCRIKEAAGCD